MHVIVFLYFLLLSRCKEPGWTDPNICNDGTGWRVIPDPYKFHEPPKPYDDKWNSEKASIVVLISALRESRCPKTIADLVSKAKHPERINFGIVQQNDEMADVDCQEGACKLLGTPAVKNQDGTFSAGGCVVFNRIRMIRMSHTSARGPVFARGHQHLLVEPQDDFCMQIDAHTDAVKEWDVRILAEWGAVSNEYAVLTSYPTNVHDLDTNSNNHWEMPILCTASFIGSGLIRNAQASACANLERPALSPLWAAGLSFAKCHAERNVPNDKSLKGVFMGEEYARGARLWTHGYDFYVLSRPIIGTYYGVEKGGMGSFGSKPGESEFSGKRLSTLLRWPNSDQSQRAYDDLGTFGLGTRRSLDQYAAFSGVDPINQKLESKCTNLTLVPWLSYSDVYKEAKDAPHPHGPIAPPPGAEAGSNGKTQLQFRDYHQPTTNDDMSKWLFVLFALGMLLLIRAFWMAGSLKANNPKFLQ